MKRRTFLQLVVMLSSKAIFAPRIAYANDTEEDGYVYLTPDLAVDFASRFAQEIDDDDTCTASNPILAYSEAGNPIGYVVNIFKNGQKNGYVILDARQDNIVTRFSFGPNILNPWESMQKDEILLKKAPKLNQNDSGRLVMASPLDFGIADNELTSYVTPDCQSIIPISRTASLRSSVQWGDIPIPVSIFHSTYKVNSSAYIGELPYVTETEIERNTKRYACAVTALFSVAGRLYLNGKPLITATSMFGQSPDWNEYISIWSATNTTTAYIKNGIEYGSTKSNDLGPGFSHIATTKATIYKKVTLELPYLSNLNNKSQAIVIAYLLHKQYLTEARSAILWQLPDGWMRQGLRAMIQLSDIHTCMYMMAGMEWLISIITIQGLHLPLGLFSVVRN